MANDGIWISRRADHGRTPAARAPARDRPRRRVPRRLRRQAHRGRGRVDIACRLANACAELGVGPGDRVATLIENSTEAHAGLVGRRAGRCHRRADQHRLQGPVPAPPAGRLGLARSLIVEADLVDRVAAVAPSSGRSSSTWCRDRRGSRPRPAPVPPSTLGRPARRPTTPTPTVDVRPSDLATFVYTGGTTGPSKGCMLSHNYHEALTRQIGICWERTRRRRGVDPAAAVPLQRHHHRGARAAGVRAAGPPSTSSSRCRTSGRR